MATVESPAPARSAKSRHGCRSRFTERSTDYQHMSVAALVGVADSRGEEGSEVGWSAQVKSELGGDGFGR